MARLEVNPARGAGFPDGKPLPSPRIASRLNTNVVAASYGCHHGEDIVEPAFTLGPVTSPAELRAEPLRRLFLIWQAAGPGLPLGASLSIPKTDPLHGLLWQFEVMGPCEDFRCVMMGEGTARTYGIDPTGQPVTSLARSPFVGRVISILRLTCRDMAPVRFASESSVIPGRDLYDIEALSLPLGGPDGGVAGIIGATVARDR